MDWRDVNPPPRISVLISSYNNARFVAKKLAEIQASTIFREAEFLFIETGSPERERDLFLPFCHEHPNCRVVATDDRRNLYQAWNLGWREARAPIVCYSNMDDAMHPKLLERVVARMEQTGADVCTALIAKQPMDDQWNSWTTDRIATLPLSTRFGPFTAWKTRLRSTLGEFDERFIAAGDKEFWSRIARLKLSVALVPEILYLYTRNPESLSLALRQTERWQKEKAMLEQMDLTWPAQLRWRVRLIRLRRIIQRRFGIVAP